MSFLRQPYAGSGEIGSYAELATQLELSPGAVTVAIKRLRARFGDYIRQEVMKTVNDEENFNAEMDSLYAALGK